VLARQCRGERRQRKEEYRQHHREQHQAHCRTAGSDSQTLVEPGLVDQLATQLAALLENYRFE
jgi:hypothetical protein